MKKALLTAFLLCSLVTYASVTNYFIWVFSGTAANNCSRKITIGNITNHSTTAFGYPSELGTNLMIPQVCYGTNVETNTLVQYYYLTTDTCASSPISNTIAQPFGTSQGSITYVLDFSPQGYGKHWEHGVLIGGQNLAWKPAGPYKTAIFYVDANQTYVTVAQDTNIYDVASVTGTPVDGCPHDAEIAFYANRGLDSAWEWNTLSERTLPNTFTFNIWLRWYDLVTKPTAAAFASLSDNWFSATGDYIYFGLNGGEPTCYMPTTGGVLTGISTSTAISDGNWHMLTYVFQNGNLYFYFDGVPDSGNPYVYSDVLYLNRVTICGYWDTGYSLSIGTYGDCWATAVFTKALSQSEITYLYNSGTGRLWSQINF